MAGYIGNKSSVTLVDGYTEAEADAEFVTKTGDSMTGGLTITTADNTNQLTIVSTDADANAGPNLNFRRNSASPADGDLTGQFTFTNNNDAGEGTDYATMYALSADVSNGSEDAAFYIKTMSAGTLRQRISLTDTATVFNEDSLDLDFRVESDNLTHALFVQGSDGKVGIGTDSPSAPLTVKSPADAEAIHVVGRSDDIGQIKFLEADGTTELGLIDARNSFFNIASIANIPLKFGTNNSERMHIDASGRVTTPNQPAFMVNPNNTQENILPNGIRVVTWDVERFDQGGDFANNSFTAPVTGKYQLNTELRLDNVDTSATYYHLYLVTSNKTYHNIIQPRLTSDAAYWSLSTSVLADMDAGDTAYVGLYQANGVTQTDVSNDSNFSGYLVA